jgi:TetR/AcrR family transcriptional regulator, cholesterol catabolism regulator
MAVQTNHDRRRSARSKHDAILEAAVRAFGRDGYEDSRWADVAKSVGIGSTALYHYFESKLHCLYVIMADTLQANLEQFEADTRDATDYPAALQTVLRAGFDVTEQQVLCNRVLVAEQARLAAHRTSPREEEARARARARTRDMEFAWATFLARAMEQGAIPEADPRLLTRAVLGLHNSVWHWYRADGDLSLADVADFFVDRCLAVLGLPASAAVES